MTPDFEAEARSVAERSKLYGPPPPLRDECDDPRAAVTERLVQLCEERLERVDAHRRRIVSEGRRMGREVVAHRLTLTNAEKRMARLVFATDPEVAVPLWLVPYPEARRLANEAFTDGYNSTHRRVS